MSVVTAECGARAPPRDGYPYRCDLSLAPGPGSVLALRLGVTEPTRILVENEQWGRWDHARAFFLLRVLGTIEHDRILTVHALSLIHI